MKILHTSDWHLGKRLENFSRYEEQQAVMDEICAIADQEEVNAVLVTGDLFDTFNPPTEAIELFYKTLKRLTDNGNRPVVAIAGNHDSPDRIESPEPLARECGILFIGYPNTVVPSFELDSGLKVLRTEEGFVELRLPGVDSPLRILHTAYANEFRLQTYLGNQDEEKQMQELLKDRWDQIAQKNCDSNGVNVLISHLFFVKKGEPSPAEPEEEKPILHLGGVKPVFSSDLPNSLQYAGLGHLHKMQNIDSESFPVIYSGSPLSYSFSEENQKKYVLLVDVDPGTKAIVKEIELTKGKRLLRYRAENMDEAMEWLEINQDSLVELTLVSDLYLTANDRKQLNNVHQGIVSLIPEIRNKELLTTTKSSLDLTKSMEELFKEYFMHEKGQEPNEKIKELFKEILSQKD